MRNLLLTLLLYFFTLCGVAGVGYAGWRLMGFGDPPVYSVQMFMDGSYFCCTHERSHLRCRGVYIFNASNYIDTTKECPE